MEIRCVHSRNCRSFNNTFPLLLASIRFLQCFQSSQQGLASSGRTSNKLLRSLSYSFELNVLSSNLSGSKELRLPKHIEEHHIDKSLHTCSTRKRNSLSEQHLRNSVQSLTKMEYSDPSIRRALRKHCLDTISNMKNTSKYPDISYVSNYDTSSYGYNHYTSPGKDEHKKDPRTVDLQMAVDLLRHCEVTRVRDTVVLNACADAFIANSSSVLPTQLRWFVTPFGKLNYMPPQPAYEAALLRCLDQNFLKAPACDMLTSLLALTYQGKCSPHIAKLVFTPKFIDGLQGPSVQPWSTTLMDLKCLDDAMTLEYSAIYPGPMFAMYRPDRQARMQIRRNRARADNRVRQLLSKAGDDFQEAAGKGKRFTRSVKITRLPGNTEVCLADLVLHPSDIKEAAEAAKTRDKNIAVLVNLPEHVCVNADEKEPPVLTGSQEMRKRHLRKLGFKVAMVDYTIMSGLLPCPRKLKSYLKSSLEEAVPAI